MSIHERIDRIFEHVEQLGIDVEIIRKRPAPKITEEETWEEMKALMPDLNQTILKEFGAFCIADTETEEILITKDYAASIHVAFTVYVATKEFKIEVMINRPGGYPESQTETWKSWSEVEEINEFFIILNEERRDFSDNTEIIDIENYFVQRWV